MEITPRYGRTEAKIGLRVAERIIIFEARQLILALYFKMLSVVLSGLVLIRVFFEETYTIFMPTCWFAFTRNTLNILHLTFIFT